MCALTADIDQLQTTENQGLVHFRDCRASRARCHCHGPSGPDCRPSWIGGLKAFKYEAAGIVPFVANTPLMSFFYADPGHYKAHMNPERALVPANVEWHEKNHTYTFAYGLGAVIVVLGLLLWSANSLASATGGFRWILVFLMSLVTLSFPIPTPGRSFGVPASATSTTAFPVPELGRAAGSQRIPS